jgi:hypothetical protein
MPARYLSYQLSGDGGDGAKDVIGGGVRDEVTVKKGRSTWERVLPTGSILPGAPPDRIHHRLTCSYWHERGRRHWWEGGGRQREEREVVAGTEREK